MTKTTITITSRHNRIFGVAYQPGEEVEVWEADGFSFPTEAAAAEFEQAPWPRTLHDGRHVTSDRVVFKADDRARAEARQAHLEGGPR